MRKLYENFNIFRFQKRIASAETIRGNTVFNRLFFLCFFFFGGEGGNLGNHQEIATIAMGNKHFCNTGCYYVYQKSYEVGSKACYPVGLNFLSPTSVDSPI